MTDYLPAMIRDARGLKADEKAFLYTIASHKKHAHFANVPTSLVQMGLTRSAYYRTVSSLKAKHVITAKARLRLPTEYRINESVLLALSVPDGDTVPDRDAIPDGNTGVPDRDGGVPDRDGGVPPAAHQEELEEEPQTEREDKNSAPAARSQFTASVDGIDWIVAEGAQVAEKRTKPLASVPKPKAYAYTKFDGSPCCLCGTDVYGGTLLLHRPTGKRKAAHHIDECSRVLTDEERVRHLAGNAPDLIATPRYLAKTGA